MNFDKKEKIINKLPLSFRLDSPYIKINDFDQNVKDYCQSLKQLKSDLRCSKVIVIGSMGCGKTSLVHRFVNNTFNNDYKSTIGVDFEIEQFTILNTIFNLQIWDTAGQERFKCIASAYYRGAQAIIVVFDLVDNKTLYSSEKWLIEALKVIEYNQKTPFIFLVGTKKDLLDKCSDSIKNETHTNAQNLASRLNAEYWPLSSLTGENVDKFFYRVAGLTFNETIKNEFEMRTYNSCFKKLGTKEDLNKIEIKDTNKELDVFGLNKCC